MCTTTTPVGFQSSGPRSSALQHRRGCTARAPRGRATGTEPATSCPQQQAPEVFSFPLSPGGTLSSPARVRNPSALPQEFPLENNRFPFALLKPYLVHKGKHSTFCPLPATAPGQTRRISPRPSLKCSTSAARMRFFNPFLVQAFRTALTRLKVEDILFIGLNQHCHWKKKKRSHQPRVVSEEA